jgi:hypothetical protein
LLDAQQHGAATALQKAGAVALAIVGAAFAWRALAVLPLGTLADPGPGAGPLLLSVLLIACALWSLMGGAGSSLLAEEEPEEDAGPGGLRHAGLIAAAVVVAALAIEPLGYRLTLTAILLFFIAGVERKSPLAAAVVAFALAFGSYALFDRVLKVSLPTGPFGI